MNSTAGTSLRTRIFVTTALGALAMSLPAGCGSGGGNSNLSTSNGDTIAGRSFSVSPTALGAGQTGSLIVAVGSDASTIAATLNLAIASVSKSAQSRQTSVANAVNVALIGSLNAVSGAFTVSGLTVQNGKAVPVTVAGTLTKAGTTGGATQITIGGQTYNASFAPGVALTGQFSEAYFPLIPNPQYIYQDIGTTQDATDQPTTVTVYDPEAGYSYLGGSGLSGFGSADFVVTQVQLAGVTVNRAAILNDAGNPIHYSYYTVDSSGIRKYGDDDFNNFETPVGVDSFRDNPPYLIPFTLNAGQTLTQNLQETATNFAGTASQRVSIRPLTASFTFNDFESITVPAGTFPHAAKFTSKIVEIYADSGGGPSETDTTTETLYLVSGIGPVQDSSVETDVVPASEGNAGSTATFTDTTVLTSTTGSKAVSGNTRSRNTTGSTRSRLRSLLDR